MTLAWGGSRGSLSGWLGLFALLACGGQSDERPDTAQSVTRAVAQHADSLVATSANGTEVWFTLVRKATRADGARCTERGLELRRGATRVKVPLLYTGSPPVLLNDSTMRALLWNDCVPGDAYLVNLRTGHPVRERIGRMP